MDLNRKKGLKKMLLNRKKGLKKMVLNKKPKWLIPAPSKNRFGFIIGNPTELNNKGKSVIFPPTLLTTSSCCCPLLMFFIVSTSPKSK
jgi:hypothetical protein